eukprot:6046312-Prymnesium_polylepis.1
MRHRVPAHTQRLGCRDGHTMYRCTCSGPARREAARTCRPPHRQDRPSPVQPMHAKSVIEVMRHRHVVISRRQSSASLDVFCPCAPPESPHHVRTPGDRLIAWGGAKCVPSAGDRHAARRSSRAAPSWEHDGAIVRRNRCRSWY